MPVDLKKETAIKKLNLRKETLELAVKDKQMDFRARVAVVLDKSGSMRKLYRDGSVQNLLERLFPIALKFDDNGELDFWLFNDSFLQMPPVMLGNFYDYADTVLMTGIAAKFWGQTMYAPVMGDVIKKYVEEEPDKIPTYIIFITDGNNSDKKNTKIVLTNASHYNLFWQFVGIGDEKFDFLKKLDDLSGRYIDNANFFEASNLNKLTDMELYDLLLAEYPSWLTEAKKLRLI